MAEQPQEAGGEAPAGPMTVDQAVDRLAASLEQSDETTLEDEAGEGRQTADLNAEPEDEDEDVDTDQASDESEDEDEDADPEDDDEDQADKQSEYVDDSAKVRLDDGTEVTVADLKRGSLMQSDYTKKTQEVAQERQAVRQTQDRLNSYSEAILERLQMADALAQYAAPMPPDETLRETDPVQYMMAQQDYQAAVADFNQRVGQIRQAIAETRQVQGEAAQTQASEELEHARTKLREMVPELSDPEKSRVVIADIVATANALGFSSDEVTSWRDPRIGHMAYLASQAKKLEGQKPKAASKTKGKPPVQRAKGKPSEKSSKRGKYAASMKRLQKTGSQHDAVEALAAKMGLDLD